MQGFDRVATSLPDLQASSDVDAFVRGVIEDPVRADNPSDQDRQKRKNQKAATGPGPLNPRFPSDPHSTPVGHNLVPSLHFIQPCPVQNSCDQERLSTDSPDGLLVSIFD